MRAVQKQGVAQWPWTFWRLTASTVTRVVASQLAIVEEELTNPESGGLLIQARAEYSASLAASLAPMVAFQRHQVASQARLKAASAGISV